MTFPLRQKVNRLEAKTLILPAKTAEPHTPDAGMIVTADGSNWDPAYDKRARPVAYNSVAQLWENAAGEVVTETTLSAAQILALNTTPRTLIGGVSGCIWVPVWAYLFLDFATTPYDGIASGEDLAFRHGDESGPVVATIETTGFLDAVADAKRVFINSGLSTCGSVGDDVVIHMLTGNVASGDSPVTVRAGFRLLNIA